MVKAVTPATTFSPVRVNRVVAELTRPTAAETQRRWLAAVAVRVTVARPDLADALVDILGVEPEGQDVLAGLSIGEIGVCYEALLSNLDRDSRKSSGQFFTPDDAAAFMAAKSAEFPAGKWLDPCCGVGNLSWHLAAAHDDPGHFVGHQLVLIDRDRTALRTAVAVIAAEFLREDDQRGITALAERAVCRDFLAPEPLPEHDFVIVNPPYARAPKLAGYRTASCQDLFAYFLERIATESRGFIAVTPASYLAAPKFQPLRDVLDEHARGGEVYAFDNVPDTLFRGYKYGSANTSKTNFVRAAITVCAPERHQWQITPIIRWQVAQRPKMFASVEALLGPRRLGPAGEWAKLAPGMAQTWDYLRSQPLSLAELTVSGPTEFSLDVPQTPRYYISATYRTLERGSKAVLYFASEADRDQAALVLNSSIPYLWWRALDGGVTLPKRVLLSTPLPQPDIPAEQVAELVAELKASEEENLVEKLNAGRQNQNVKHPESLVRKLNNIFLPDVAEDALALVYTNNMFI